MFPSSVFQQVQACFLESDFVQFIGGCREKRAGSKCWCSQWGATWRSLSPGFAYFPRSVHPETPAQAAEQPVTSLVSCFWFSLYLSSLKTSRRFYFSGDSLFLSVNRQGSRMDMVRSAARSLSQPVCIVNWLLPHSWNLAKPTLTCLVYVSFISESTFPHWFLLIRPAWGCFAGPRRVRSHCVASYVIQFAGQTQEWCNLPTSILQTRSPPIMRFFSLLLGVLLAAAQITVLRSLQEEQPVFYVEEIATYPTIIFSCDYFYSRKGNLDSLGSTYTATRRRQQQ